MTDFRAEKIALQVASFESTLDGKTITKITVPRQQNRNSPCKASDVWCFWQREFADPDPRSKPWRITESMRKGRSLYLKTYRSPQTKRFASVFKGASFFSKGLHFGVSSLGKPEIRTLTGRLLALDRGSG
jgi:hypothetical protein